MDKRDTGDINRNTGAALAGFVEDHQADVNTLSERLGEIEKLPVEGKSVDVIISNCVINLAPDKSKVFQEAYRALKPGGRIIVSDIVSKEHFPMR